MALWCGLLLHWYPNLNHNHSHPAPCGLRGCMNRPAPFPGRTSYKATKPGLVSVLYLSMRYTVLFLLLCVLFVVVKLSVLTMWLARKTPLRKPNHGEGSSPQSPSRRLRMIFLVYCIASLFHYVFVLSPDTTWYNYFPTFMARYSLFVLEVQLNPKQTNKPDPPITLTLTLDINK